LSLQSTQKAVLQPRSERIRQEVRRSCPVSQDKRKEALQIIILSPMNINSRSRDHLSSFLLPSSNVSSTFCLNTNSNLRIMAGSSPLAHSSPPVNLQTPPLCCYARLACFNTAVTAKRRQAGHSQLVTTNTRLRAGRDVGGSNGFPTLSDSQVSCGQLLQSPWYKVYPSGKVRFISGRVRQDPESACGMRVSNLQRWQFSSFWSSGKFIRLARLAS
jgi:hypothetical protein